MEQIERARENLETWLEDQGYNQLEIDRLVNEILFGPTFTELVEQKMNGELNG